MPSNGLRLQSAPCGASLAWTSALIGGLTVRDDDLAASMVLFFVLLIFLVIGLLRAYKARVLLDILMIFLPTIAFVACLGIWSTLRAHLSNASHSSLGVIQTPSGLLELVAANGLISCSPMLLCETTFHVSGLLSKRVVPTASKWVKNTAYVARLINMIALIMVVVASCDFASYLTAWLDQTKLAAVLSSIPVAECATTVLGRDLTLLPLMADGAELVVLLVLTVVTIVLRLRYKLEMGVVVHVTTIQACLALHFAWKCVRDWTTFQNYVDGDWDHPGLPLGFHLEGGLEGLAQRIRKDAEDPTLFYLLGIVPLVLAMVSIYTLNLASYTNPPANAVPMSQQLMSRFRLFLDPTAPRIELLPTGKTVKAADGKMNAGGKGKEIDAKAKGGEMYVVKRGWLGGWSVTPATAEVGVATRMKRRIKEGITEWVMGWPTDQIPAAVASK